MGRTCNLFSGLFLFILAACSSESTRREITLIRSGDRYEGVFVPQKLITGADPGFTLRLRNSATDMLGHYKKTNDGLEFRPVFVLQPGFTYEVWSGGKKIAEKDVPAARGARPAVIRISPAGDTLPENLLKIYIEFSRPMRQGVSSEYAAMLSSRGDVLPGTFLDLNPELWDESGRILTLWLDPGRIKRGLQPNERLGNPLQKGNKYIISISEEWPDLNGITTGKAYSRPFIAGVRDMSSPDPRKWQLTLPQAGTKNELIIHLDEPLDRTLLGNCLSITDASYRQMSVTLMVSEDQKEVRFAPAAAWQPGRYTLHTDARLEDLAGNNINKLFDYDALKMQPKKNTPVYTQEFSIR